jgi:minor extracellular serine protease Vpr
VRSAVVNTAERTVLKAYNTGNPTQNVNVIGAGRENLFSAVSADLALDPVSVSFGAVPSGSGQGAQFPVTITNVSGGAATFDVAVGAGDASVAYSASPASLSLGAGESGVVTVSMQTAKGAAAGGHQAWLTFSSGGSEVAHAAVYTLIK